MQVQQVKNINPNNVNFSARLKISGSIDDISSKQLKEWSKKVQMSGNENDVIELIFGEPTVYRANVPDVWRQNKFKKGKNNLNKQIIMRRAISSNITLENGKSFNYKPQSYWSEFSKNISKKNQKSYHKKLTNFSVSKLLKFLKSVIEKANKQ